MTIRGAISAAVGLLASGAVVAPAAAPAATYGVASIESVSGDAQFDVADSSVISANGRYLAFRGSVDGRAGVWRRDLLTGSLDAVAVDLPGVAFPNLDPQAPSISADGRYIAFNTRAPLNSQDDPAPAPRPWNVYVRDMDVDGGKSGAYTLASAINGGTQALTYAGGTGARIAGAQANPARPAAPTAPGGAITADGREVVFVVDSQSNLTDPSSVTTPPGQVAVRNLNTKATTLVTVKATGGPVDAIDRAVANDDAVISADGSTVAWISPLGALQQEARTQPGEDTLTNAGTSDLEGAWRRVADGPGAPTLRITGPVDPGRPGCAQFAGVTFNHVPPACQGPLAVDDNLGAQFSHVGLSGDGYTAVLLTPAALLGHANGGRQEAYRVDMRPGLTRGQATQALTQAVTFSGSSPPGEADISAITISADGSTVALSTARTRFDLPSPSYIGPPRPDRAAANELYVVDLARGTIDLVTGGIDGSFADYPDSCGGSGTLSPSLSADGSLTAFDGCADNLVWGDGNAASDVFIAGRLHQAGSAAPTQTKAVRPPPLVLTPAWVLHATARSLANGTLRLDILVPSRGRLRVQATARTAARTVHGRRTRGNPVRTVASSAATPRHGSLVSLTVRVDRRYLALVRRAGGLRAVARLWFTAPGLRGRLTDAVAVDFRAVSSRHVRSRRKK